MHWDVNKVDVSGALVVALASSEHDRRDRWTELRVYYMPEAKRPWLAEARGVSCLPGEADRIRRLASPRLERALTIFDDSDLGVIVKETAREYAEDHGIPKDLKGVGVATDQEALALLFGEMPSMSAAARALGLGESSLRMALKNGTDVRVPLRKLLPYIDRACFQRAQQAEENRRA